MKLVWIVNHVTLNHLPHVFLVKSILLSYKLIADPWSHLPFPMNTPGRRATFMHCRRASAALVQASMPLEEARSPSWRAFIWPLAKSMWFWNICKYNIGTCNFGKFTGYSFLSLGFVIILNLALIRKLKKCLQLGFTYYPLDFYLFFAIGNL